MIFLKYSGLNTEAVTFVLKYQCEFKGLVTALVGESQADFLEKSSVH